MIPSHVTHITNSLLHIRSKVSWCIMYILYYTGTVPWERVRWFEWNEIKSTLNAFNNFTLDSSSWLTAQNVSSWARKMEIIIKYTPLRESRSSIRHQLSEQVDSLTSYRFKKKKKINMRFEKEIFILSLGTLQNISAWRIKSLRCKTLTSINLCWEFYPFPRTNQTENVQNIYLCRHLLLLLYGLRYAIMETC